MTINRAVVELYLKAGMDEACYQGCRLSLLSTVPVLIPKDIHASEPLEYCFIEYSLSLMSSARESHFPCGQQRGVLDSKLFQVLPFYPPRHVLLY
jgi:hypothetical protein